MVDNRGMILNPLKTEGVEPWELVRGAGVAINTGYDWSSREAMPDVVEKYLRGLAIAARKRGRDYTLAELLALEPTPQEEPHA